MAEKVKHCGMRSRKGKFVEIFRTTPVQTVCPNFYVLAHADGCMFRPQCSYCYLKSSFWYLKGQQAFINTAKMAREIRKWMARDNLETYMLNAGNLSDSLSFEQVRPLMTTLVDVFREAEARGRPHTLLLVTKGGLKECANLFRARPCRNVVVSFSVNNPAAAAKHERGAATVASRLAAARRLKKLGWRVRIRIDPMILGYDYTGVIEAVRKLRPERVTLGTIRAEKNLPRYVGGGVLDGLEPAADGKSLSRYPRAKRMALYRKAVRALRGVCPVGLCEELPDVWDDLGLDRIGKKCNCCV